MIQLSDDGTLDTVLVCSECNKEFRYSYAISDESFARSYDEFVEWAIADATDDHDCNDPENDFL